MSINRTRFLSAWQPWFLRRSRRPALCPQPTSEPSAESLEDRRLPRTWTTSTSSATGDLYGAAGSSATNLYAAGVGSPAGGAFLIGVGIIETFGIAS